MRLFFDVTKRGKNYLVFLFHNLNQKEFVLVFVNWSLGWKPFEKEVLWVLGLNFTRTWVTNPPKSFCKDENSKYISDKEAG